MAKETVKKEETKLAVAVGGVTNTLKDALNKVHNIEWDVVLESLKAPARQILLAVYAFLVNEAFRFVATRFGFEFTEDHKAQILSYGTSITWALLSWADRILHLVGKKREESKSVDTSLLTRGIARF